MSDLFEEDEEEVIEVVDDFDDVEVDTEIVETSGVSLDARRRLENMLEEKRLQDELKDFMDY
ncbi:hypothetical protein EP47_04530 [Legionella norrlandica]|uniref:Leucyl-tRNA synthetase n=1 Tax=Legionella norrlandica TaxID=1498499 RepID=A0A0A2SU24_9GAMM|nr:hypothetical protein [Legionella norrlandica]KGP63231.1 hypothetical protein EP47_04530 [Legionella norrlandica]